MSSKEDPNLLNLQSRSIFNPVNFNNGELSKKKKKIVIEKVTRLIQIFLCKSLNTIRKKEVKAEIKGKRKKKVD